MTLKRLESPSRPMAQDAKHLRSKSRRGSEERRNEDRTEGSRRSKPGTCSRDVPRNSTLQESRIGCNRRRLGLNKSLCVGTGGRCAQLESPEWRCKSLELAAHNRAHDTWHNSSYDLWDDQRGDPCCIKGYRDGQHHPSRCRCANSEIEPNIAASVSRLNSAYNVPSLPWI